MPTPTPQNDPHDDETPQGGQAPADPAETAQTPPPDEPGNRRKDAASEAANYRRQLREAEAKIERDAQIRTASNRREVEQVLTSSESLTTTTGGVATLARAADLWEVLGATADQFHNPDDGSLDAVALADFIAEHTAERGYLLRQPETPSPVFNPLDIAANLRRTNPDGSYAGSSENPWHSALTRNT